MTGGSGDADLNLWDPTGTEVAVAWNTGNEERIWIANPDQGVWELEVEAFEDYAGATLTVTLNAQAPNAGADIAQLAGDYEAEGGNILWSIGAGGNSTMDINIGGNYTVEGTLTWNQATGLLIMIDEDNAVTGHKITDKTGSGFKLTSPFFSKTLTFTTQ